LWQIHELVDPEEPGKVFTQGVLDYLLKAKEQGKIRYIGFTGHHLTSTHLAMLEGGFDFDTVQMPLSILDYHFRSYQRVVLPRAVEKNLGILAMKTLGGSPGAVPESGAATVEECLRYAMSLPVSTVVSGMETLDKLKQNIATAKAFSPMSEAEMTALRERTESFGNDGRFESYKTAWHVDIQDKMRERGLTPS